MSFDILDHGAVSDGKTLNTAAIQAAIDACHQAGGGTVRCGPGAFLTGSLMLKSHVELYLAPGCRIIGSPRLEDYPEFIAQGYRHQRAPEHCNKYLIGGIEAENVAVTGPGTIDGSGLAFYGSQLGKDGKHPKPDTPRPRIVMLYRCRGVRIEDVTLVDSPCWTCWLMQCETVNIHRVKIRADRRMRNVDGIDLDSCRDVVVSDCIIRTEDDCIVVRAIKVLYDTPAACENIVVDNCVLDSGCQAVRVGCPGDGVIRHCTFNNLVIHSLSNGIVFDNPARYLRQPPGTVDVRHVVFSNVTIKCGKVPIKIYVEEGIELTRIADLRFDNFSIESGGPCLIQGSAQTTIDNVSLSNIQIHTSGDEAIVTRHCRGIKLNNVELSNRPASA